MSTRSVAVRLGARAQAARTAVALCCGAWYMSNSNAMLVSNRAVLTVGNECPTCSARNTRAALSAPQRAAHQQTDICAHASTRTHTRSSHSSFSPHPPAERTPLSAPPIDSVRVLALRWPHVRMWAPSKWHARPQLSCSVDEGVGASTRANGPWDTPKSHAEGRPPVLVVT